MGIHSLTYVSRGTTSIADAELDSIIETANLRNKEMSITGALIRGDVYFAQILEGAEENVRELLDRISQDSRHCDLRVVQDESISARCFPLWSMAYLGSSLYVDRLIKRLLTSAHDSLDVSSAAADLRKFMLKMSR